MILDEFRVSQLIVVAGKNTTKEDGRYLLQICLLIIYLLFYEGLALKLTIFG